MKKRAVYDLLFYLIIPLFIWNVFKKEFGSYYAMLLTSLPGFIYTIYSFLKDKKYNVPGIYILTASVIGRILDVVSHSAEQMLWNDVYMHIAHASLWIITIVIKKPMAIYFIEYFYTGADRNTKELFRKKELFKYFQYLTLLYALMYIEKMIVKVWAIKTYGVDGFNYISIIMRVNGYILPVLTLPYIIFMWKKIRRAASDYYDAGNNNLALKKLME